MIFPIEVIFFEAANLIETYEVPLSCRALVEYDISVCELQNEGGFLIREVIQRESYRSNWRMVDGRTGKCQFFTFEWFSIAKSSVIQNYQLFEWLKIESVESDIKILFRSKDQACSTAQILGCAVFRQKEGGHVCKGLKCRKT